MAGFLVSLSGIDGAGKTTLARSVSMSLQDNGLPTNYAWARFGSLMVDKLVATYKSTIIQWKNSGETERSFQSLKSSFLSSRIVAAPYLVFVLINYYFQIVRRVSLPLRRGEMLICDRYIFDTFIDLGAELHLDHSFLFPLLDIYLWVLPKPDLAFMIHIPENVAYARKDDIPSQEYLHRRHELYKRLLNRYHFVLLSGIQSPDDLHNEVMRRILDEYGKGF